MKRLYVELNPITEGYYWLADSDSVKVFSPFLRVWVDSSFRNESDIVDTGMFKLISNKLNLK